MLRRFLLVGLYVSFPTPFHQGSVMQIALANLTAILYTALQLQTMPYTNIFDNYLALGSSLSLNVILLCTIFYKYESLTAMAEIQQHMSVEQIDDFTVTGTVLTVLFIASVFGALGLSAGLLTVQLAKERLQQLKDAHLAKARRLRRIKDDAVASPELVLKGFHVFLVSTMETERKTCKA